MVDIIEANPDHRRGDAARAVAGELESSEDLPVPYPLSGSASAEPSRPSGVERLSRLAARVRSRLVFAFLDGVIVVAAYGVAEVAFLRDRAPAHYWHRFLWFVLLALVVHVGANRLFGLYGRIWRHAGVEEARNIVGASATALFVLLLAYPLSIALQLKPGPVQMVLLGCALATMGIGTIRFHSRLLGWQRGTRAMGLRVAVVGSRDAGASAVREMLRSPEAGLFPVAVFDDDRRSHGLSVIGVPVVGAVDDLPAVAARLNIQQVLLAIPRPSKKLVERCLRAAEQAGITLKIIPGVRELVGSVTSPPPQLRTAREPRIEDLLGRAPVSTDLRAVRATLEGRRVLVTGAGGSIGAEICCQVARFSPGALIMLDRDETHLHDVAASLPRSEPCFKEQVLADVADQAAVEEVFGRFMPQVVFHAAAHKHVPILETHVVEGIVANVTGTLNVLWESSRHGVERFVFVSTDKAVQPVSVMGATKRVGEMIVEEMSPRGSPFCSVRFGNVLGSRGSVIPTFRQQIASGGPVTVTDPRMTRYFMSVEEAVQLVLQAGVLATGGDVFMLEMGEPVRILDLAHRMIRLSGFNPGTDIAIRIVGTRPGEKLHEELHASSEQLVDTSHRSIKRLIRPNPAGGRLHDSLQGLLDAAARRDAASARDILFGLARGPDVTVDEAEVVSEDALALESALLA